MYIASLGTYNVEKWKKFLELKLCEPGRGVCLFQQIKNGLRTKFKSFNHIYFELIDGTLVRFLITVQNFRKFALV
jgi:hypothetical protein